ncbi:SRPBCC family protein [Saccharopolyspora elongata]|uniref:SRPBCC family protein n=1 Tax=Saccharopolyspora elongata TaxID=2530387 RepID=A0A4R4Z7Q3_9PSEU|nr:SRPBCC family protein [Saccharopolyspora elongata]TDD53650.1 SRPBCC family protein [Saccharopolyspora elongata]
MRPVELRLSVPVEAPPEVVWAAATDWARQGEWMLGTEVHALGGPDGPGAQLVAVTGFRGFGVVDRMEIVEWRPPQTCRVRHRGRLIVGDGGFDVVRCGNAASTFLWWERLVLPPGGALVWPVVRPAFVWGMRRSLTAFAAFCRGYSGGGETG